MDAAVLVGGAQRVEGVDVIADAVRGEELAPVRLATVGTDPSADLHLAAVGLEGAARRLRTALVVLLLAVCVTVAALAGLLT